MTLNEKIQKVVTSCQTLKQLEVAIKLVENSYEKGFLGWFELREFYQLVNSMKLKIGDSENQIEMGDL